MSIDHYENFPVASRLMPARLRPAVMAIYRFARTADDIADEGDVAPQHRMDQLDALEAQLDAIEQSKANQWPQLAEAIQKYALPIVLFRDLLSAFRQDVSVKRYPNEHALFDYCRRSANPIGRLLLHLFKRTDPTLIAWSDALCTGLQLVNFWQDIAIDWRKDRVYLPQDALTLYGVNDSSIAHAPSDTRWQALMRYQTERTRALLLSGAPLAPALGGRIGWELRLVLQGGLRILERIDQAQGDVFRARPTLRVPDWLLMTWRACRMRSTSNVPLAAPVPSKH